MITRITGIMMIVFLTITAEAQMQYVDVMKIAKIESNLNPSAVNYKEGSIGLCQIRIKGALLDWNMRHKNEIYSEDDLFDQYINIKIADWFLNERIPAMLRHYNKDVTVENILISYNAGIRYVRDGIEPPKSTKRYIKRYMESK
jgi:soluble lytic murein transglycosylase-like protein